MISIRDVDRQPNLPIDFEFEKEILHERYILLTTYNHFPYFTSVEGHFEMPLIH